MSFDATAMTRLRRVSAIAPDPGGHAAVVAAARLDDDESRYISDLWRVSLDAPGAPAQQLTRGDADDKQPRFRRDGALGFLSNRSAPGREPDEGARDRYQVWLLPAGGGDPVQLTDEPLGVSDFAFAAGGDRLIVIADVLPGVAHDDQREQAARRGKHGPTGLLYRSMPIRHWDSWKEPPAPHVIAYDADGGDRRDLTPDADDEHRTTEWGVEWDLSADGTAVAVVARALGDDRLHDTWIRVIDVASGEHRDLGAAPRVELSAPHWSPDGRQLACVRTDRPTDRPGKPTLHLLDASSGDGRPLAADFDAWPNLCAWTPDGAALLITADLRGQVPLLRVDVGSGEVTRITAEQAGGSHADIHPVGGDRVCGLRHRLHHPPEPFRAALEPDTTPELVAALSGFTEEEGRAIGRVESFDVPGDGGDPVQSFLLIPQADGPAPAQIWIHGGPMGANADGWHWRWNPLIAAAAGYVVALPNPRGSTGFGQAFIDGIWNNSWGGACYRDLMAVADAVEARPEVASGQTGALGGSFGGYMANWIGSQTDRFRYLVTHASLYCLSGFYGTTDYPAYCLLENGLSPYDDLAEYDKYSPHSFVRQWKSPTLVIHGEKDYRVPISEALMLFEALDAEGVEAELLVFPDENHWIQRPQNCRQWYREVLRFAEAHRG